MKQYNDYDNITIREEIEASIKKASHAPYHNDPIGNGNDDIYDFLIESVKKIMHEDNIEGN